MTTATLQEPTLTSPPSSGAQNFLIASTLAVALTPTFGINTPSIPTYVSTAPSELINFVFRADTNKQKLFFSLRSYRSFENDWDGYGGQIPSDQTIEDSIKFIKLLPTNVLLPYAGLSGDGEISLFWDKNKIFIDIGFRGNGQYSYYARLANGKEYFGSNLQLSSDLPSDLISILPSTNL